MHRAVDEVEHAQVRLIECHDIDGQRKKKKGLDIMLSESKFR